MHGNTLRKETRRAPESRVGQELNRKWTLLRLLGVGGAAAVYEAVHRNGHRAAVKVLSNPSIRDLASGEYAAHEASVANAVMHPGVVEILDNDVAEDGSSYLVMELLEGRTLEQRRVEAGGRLSFEEALPIFERLLEVVGAAHERDIVHRDLKPDNVFLTAEGKVKVLDFGLAAAGPREREDAPWFGTPGFMPPEQAREEWSSVDARADLWAVAATFYTVLTGRLVYPGSNPASLLLAAASNVDVDMAPVEEITGLRIADVVARALSSDRADRWPSAGAMLAALRAARRFAVPRSPRPPRLRLVALPKANSVTRVFRLAPRRDHHHA